MLEDKKGSWFEGNHRIEDDSPEAMWMRRVYPRVDNTLTFCA